MKESKPVQYLKHQSFHPGIFSIFINPLFFARLSLSRDIKKFSARLKGKILDFGCGRKPYRHFFTAGEYIGVDLMHSGHDHKNSKIDVFYDGKKIPFPDHDFDSLFCSEVLEHVPNPDEIISELNRVLKPGAPALITVPFCWNEHEMPYDYNRYSAEGARLLLEKHGFRILAFKKSGSFARVNFQLWALYFLELFRKWGKAGFALSFLFIIPINLVGSVMLLLLPKNDSLYFSNVFLAEKPDIKN